MGATGGSQVIQDRVDLVDGSWLTLDIHGDPAAPALVVVPGVMSDARAWRRMAGAITAWPAVAVVNRRGRHPSGDLPPGYSLATELDDVAAAIGAIPSVSALFGWSYGGLIALTLASRINVPQVLAYEPVVRPFAAHALGDLEEAHQDGDLDRTVEIVCGQISGMDAAAIEALRTNSAVWEAMRALARPVYAETVALNESPPPEAFARSAPVDLVVGGNNRGRAPYGTSFEHVQVLTPHAGVHELPGQGHMAHLEAPEALAHVLDSLRTPA